MNWVEVTQILGNFYPFLGRKVTQSYANFFTQFAKTKMGNFLPKKGKSYPKWVEFYLFWVGRDISRLIVALGDVNYLRMNQRLMQSENNP
jgi:hypothetical protein